MLFNIIAKRALAEYNVKDYALTFIRHSDCVTYKVDAPDSGAYLLRIHAPVTRAMGSHGNDSDMIQSELLWLEALNQDTDLVLQKPVKNQAGELVTHVSADDASCPVNCTLLHWVNGQPYHRDLESEQTAHQIGVTLAKLHIHANQWEIPAGFKRPKRDIQYFESVLRGIHPALKDRRVNPADYSEFEQSVMLLADMLHTLEKNRHTYGIMHADSHKGNMLYDDGKIRLIDFSFCAFGNFMFDLGICCSDMKQNLHRVFLQGYQNLRVLPYNYQRLIEGFFVGSMVGTFSFWVDNPSAQELLVRKFPQIAREYAARFNQGEHFWFS